MCINVFARTYMRVCLYVRDCIVCTRTHMNVCVCMWVCIVKHAHTCVGRWVSMYVFIGCSGSVGFTLDR